MVTDAPLLVDSHVHVASRDEQRYPRQPSAGSSDWWRTGGDVDELRTALDGAGVARAVVVQAIALYRYDCRYAADVVAADEDRFALVGTVDMAGVDPVADLDALASSAPMAGVRLFGVGVADPGWLTDGRGADVWDAAAELGCVVVPTIFSDGMGALRALIERQPRAVVALDHCAFPDLATSPDGGGAVGSGFDAAWNTLLGLADLPALHLKVTSHNLDDGNDPAAFLEPLVAAFGADRVCWGSDHPQHVSRTYGEMVALAQQAARNLPAPEQAAFLGANSQRLWWPHVVAAS